MSRSKPELIELDGEELLRIVDRSEKALLGAEDREKLRSTIETLRWVIAELEKERTTLARLRKSLSITTKKTEKTSEVLKGADGKGQTQGKSDEKKKKKPKGHGRNGTDAYTGAERIEIPHESLKHGDPCPSCEQGTLYQQKPRRLVRLRGEGPISARKWEVERLRCGLCGKIFTAEIPAGVGEKKYDETSASMIALMKYGSGLPFNRLARLEAALGVPLPVSTQWGILAAAAIPCWPAYKDLIRTGAQGEIFHHDDTAMKVLELLKENQQHER